MPKAFHRSYHQNSSQGPQSPVHLLGSSLLPPPTNWVQSQELFFLTFIHTKLVPTFRPLQQSLCPEMFLFQALSCHPKYSSRTLFDPQLQRSPSHILCHNTWLIFFMALTSLYNYGTLCHLLLGPLEGKRVCPFLGVSKSTWPLVCTQQITVESMSTYQSQVLENTSPDQENWTFSKQSLEWSTCTQSCPALCNPVDCGPPGSSVHGIFQVRILEWVAISSSRRCSQPRDQMPIS